MIIISKGICVKKAVVYITHFSSEQLQLLSQPFFIFSVFIKIFLKQCLGHQVKWWPVLPNLYQNKICSTNLMTLKLQFLFKICLSRVDLLIWSGRIDEHACMHTYVVTHHQDKSCLKIIFLATPRIWISNLATVAQEWPRMAQDDTACNGT
jgi:hypothetical protein